jgi:hypothetical protein
MITERYRTDYSGEFVVTNTIWSGGKKRMRREWVGNPIENNHLSARAACIGSVKDAQHFNFSVLQNHKGGLLGTKKLQTYGTGEIAQLMRLDFVVEKNDQTLQKLIDTHYYNTSTIYTAPKYCIEHPGVFYPIPYNPLIISQVALAYLAAFDGHKEVFLLGYHDDAELGHNDWANHMNQVMLAYPSTKFIHVSHKQRTPDLWKNNANFSQLTHREFILYCDL